MPPTIHEFSCSKCPNSLWAHYEDPKLLAELIILHYKHEHGSKLTREEALEQVMILRPLIKPKRP